MSSQTLLLVDNNDVFVGYDSYEHCHTGKGKRHRAFVTLIFDSNNNVTLQRRKHRLFDNLWDLTAVSHPLHAGDRDESYQEASDRALGKEIGVNHVPTEKIGAFCYFARDEQNCENEYCAVLVGEYDGEFSPSPDEVYEIKKIPYKIFVAEVKSDPSKYTPWAVLAVKVLEKHFAK